MDIHPDWSPKLKLVKHMILPIDKPSNTAEGVNSGWMTPDPFSFKDLCQWSSAAAGAQFNFHTSTSV